MVRSATSNGSGWIVFFIAVGLVIIVMQTVSIWMVLTAQDRVKALNARVSQRNAELTSALDKQIHAVVVNVLPKSISEVLKTSLTRHLREALPGQIEGAVARAQEELLGALRDLPPVTDLGGLQAQVSAIKQYVDSHPVQQTRVIVEAGVQDTLAGVDTLPVIQALAARVEELSEQTQVLAEYLGVEPLREGTPPLAQHLREALPRQIEGAIARVRDQVLDALRNVPPATDLGELQAQVEAIKQYIDSNPVQQTRAIMQASVQDTVASVKSLPELESIKKIAEYVEQDPMTKVQGFVGAGTSKTVQEVAQLPSLTAIPEIRSKISTVEENVARTFPKMYADYTSIRERMEALKSKSKEDEQDYTVLFDFDSDQITRSGKRVIEDFVKREGASNKKIWLYGFADRVGGIEYNERLSLKRALAVKRALLHLGISEDRIIKVEARGEERAAVSTRDGEREPSNRRVTIIARSQERF